MKLIPLIAATAFGLLVGINGIATASAATWDQHPRIEQGNHRLVQQDNRFVRNDHRIGFLMAERLRARERMLRQQEMRMIRHRHFTRFETHRLTHEETHLGRRL